MYIDRKYSDAAIPVFDECVAPRLVSVICANGDVAKCCYTKQRHTLGNIRNRPFADIWKEGKEADWDCRACRRYCVRGTTTGRYDDHNEAWKYFRADENQFA